MGPQYRRDGKHHDAIIHDFRALLNNTQHPTHRMAIYRGMRECIKHRSGNKMYIFDERLHAMEITISHYI